MIEFAEFPAPRRPRFNLIAGYIVGSLSFWIRMVELVWFENKLYEDPQWFQKNSQNCSMRRDVDSVLLNGEKAWFLVWM